ncbi:hypothetical protein GCM10022223_53790 [Kineosporia mesophila]|uniref:DUF6924 domain-containing protein n=2 Tax=Kineosporia mesophila TaxID=566012 RepID=A0ABP7ACS6_9ACTN
MVAGVFSRDMLDWKTKTPEGRTAEPDRAPAPSRDAVPEQTPLFRTDFSDDTIWEALMDAVDRVTEDNFGARVNFVNDPALRDAPIDSLPAAAPFPVDEGAHFFVFDGVACAGEGLPVLVVSTDPDDEPPSFRASAESVPIVEGDLGSGDVPFTECAARVGDDGVLR